MEGHGEASGPNWLKFKNFNAPAVKRDSFTKLENLIFNHAIPGDHAVQAAVPTCSVSPPHN